MTETYTLDGEPLSICTTRALTLRLASLGLKQRHACYGIFPERDALIAELATRRDWPPTPYELAVAAMRPVLCEDCGKNPADPPSRLCPGCEAYCEHTGFV